MANSSALLVEALNVQRVVTPAASEAVPLISIQPQIPEAESGHDYAKHGNEWYRNFQPAYKILEQPIHTPKPLKIIVIGAGAAGLNVAYKAMKQFPPEHLSFNIYEKNDDVGGTWLENRYPGCTCDIPSHAYQFSFERNSDWSSYYAGSEEIWKYLKDWSVRSGIHGLVKFGHKVSSAKWDDASGRWQITGVDKDGKTWTDEGEVLAACHGALNSWKYPDIPGINRFRGKIMHSAAWDSSHDLTDQIVAVVGGGSSAVQIIPSIQPKVKKLIPYLRSPVWITMGFGAKYAGPGGENFLYSDERKTIFRDDQQVRDQYCRDVEGELNKRFTLMHLNSADQKMSRDFVAASMRERLGNDPHLTEKLIPNFALGCRRMTPGPDYLQSLRQPNVEVKTTTVVELTDDSIIAEDGTVTNVDTIIFATGFDVGKPSYDIIGNDGRNLREEWGEDPAGYLSIMAAGFPNMFYWIGPNGPASHGSILPVIEWHTRYMFKVLSHMQRTSIKSLSPKRSVVEELYMHTHQLLKRTAWSAPCSSWFKNGKKHGPVTAIWPGSRMHFFEAMKEPRYEDFDIEYFGNRFTYLGNGYTSSELKSSSNLTWYFDVLEKDLGRGYDAFWDLEG